MGQTKSKISAILWSIFCETVGCHFAKTSILIVGWFQRYLYHIQIRISKEFKTREPLNLLPRRFGAELCIGYDKPILICRIVLFTFRACIESSTPTLFHYKFDLLIQIKSLILHVVLGVNVWKWYLNWDIEMISIKFAKFGYIADSKTSCTPSLSSADWCEQNLYIHRKSKYRKALKTARY